MNTHTMITHQSTIGKKCLCQCWNTFLRKGGGQVMP